MRRTTNFLHALKEDLISTRTWPVAACLVLMTIAIPLLFGGSSANYDTAPSPAPLATSPKGQEGSTGSGFSKFQAKDPFNSGRNR